MENTLKSFMVLYCVILKTNVICENIKNITYFDSNCPVYHVDIMLPDIVFI